MRSASQTKPPAPLRRLDRLPQEVLLCLLGFVPPRDLLKSVVLISKHFRDFIEANRHIIWWSLVDSLLPALSTLEEEIFDEYTWHQIHRMCLFAVARRDAVAEELGDDAYSNASSLPSFLEWKSVLPDQRQAMVFRFSPSNPYTMQQRRVCLASTTHSNKQSLEFVLTQDGAPFNSFTHRCWTSNPSPDDTSQETLLFTTRYPLALLTHVWIQPFQDLRTRDRVYTWKQTYIRAYRLKDNEETTNDADETTTTTTTTDSSTKPPPPRFRPGVPSVVEYQEASDAYYDIDDNGFPLGRTDQAWIDALLEGHTPVYQQAHSGPPVDSSEWIRFDFPMGVVANVVTITLQGKHQRPPDSSEYCASVQQLTMHGIPLYEETPQPWFFVNAVSPNDFRL